MVPRTVLVVDDDELVLGMVVKILEGAKFHVLAARGGLAALKLARETDQPIDLLLSDIDMPAMTGPALGEAMKKARPEMHVMLMSGQRDGNLLVLNYGWQFIRKPFMIKKLVQMVTDVLNSDNRSQLGGEGFDSREDTAVNREKETARRSAEVKALEARNRG